MVIKHLLNGMILQVDIQKTPIHLRRSFCYTGCRGRICFRGMLFLFSAPQTANNKAVEKQVRRPEALQGICVFFFEHGVEVAVVCERNIAGWPCEIVYKFFFGGLDLFQ